ncbi:hypothetical protein FIBSPDRAFT_775782 [Athelia psychrophila]|uniref:Ctf8-domain-containing protein n=1 Tax=Athelia psychrophila TaxID=1759441 RepID=A0A166UJA1_9AGAM|nr:hypothetical protein FIBSPDRAFT_775782 [Fibularhizoctonia sp. CBS 109695]
MLIPINISIGSPNSSGPPPQLAKLGNDEIVLIELQGSLEVECTDPSERDGQIVGKFQLDEGSNKPTLAIGHHLLEGKIVSLSKPLGVMQRSSGADRGSMQDEDEGMFEKGASSVQWDVVAIVKKKIVFSKRPMPIVGKTAAPTSKKG